METAITLKELKYGLSTPLFSINVHMYVCIYVIVYVFIALYIPHQLRRF